MYENDVLKCIFTSQGRIVRLETGGNVLFNYEYNLQDHLGNTRVVFTAHSNGKPEVNQITAYDPFGYVISQSNWYPTGAFRNKNLYNGKEYQDDWIGNVKLDWYDYGARMYDPAIGRWHSVDPLAEVSRRWSPYSYCYNNPMRFIDPDGMIPWPVLKSINSYSRGITSGMYRNTDNTDGTLRKHGGVDVAFRLVSNGKSTTSNTDVNAEVVATHSGKMTYHKQKDDAAAGNYIEVENGDIKTRYLHLEDNSSLKDGEKKDVKEGDKIGEMGQSGTDNPHLHYEIMEKNKDGKWVKQNPVVNNPDKIKSFTEDVELKDPQLMINQKQKIKKQ